MKIGYARVSTKDQNLELQIDALTKFGCERIFMEKMSATKERVELEKALNFLRAGDVLIVWKLDRLGRSLKQLVNTIDEIRVRDIGFISLQDNIDTTTPVGRLNLNLIAAFAEFEKDMIRERTLAGLNAARSRGRVGGRKAGLSKDAMLTAKLIYDLYLENELKASEIYNSAKISKATFYRYIKFEEKRRKSSDQNMRNT